MSGAICRRAEFTLSTYTIEISRSSPRTRSIRIDLNLITEQSFIVSRLQISVFSCIVRSFISVPFSAALLFTCREDSVVYKEGGNGPFGLAQGFSFELDPGVALWIVHVDGVQLSISSLHAKNGEGVPVGHAGCKPDAICEVGT